MRGFSVIEVILAVALFAIFGTGVVVTVLSNLNFNQSGQEQAVASQYASEGMEAVRSVKNQSFSLLVNGTWGLVQSGGVWALSGSNNTWDKYTRTVAISDAQRDVGGNIVASGGTVDANTKKIVVTTNWNVNAVRLVSVVLTSYMTNWKAGLDDGVVAYGDTGNVGQPRYRLYSDSSSLFGAEAAAGSGFTDTAAGRVFAMDTSPTKKEAVMGYVNLTGNLRIMCFDGTTWSSDFTVAVGGNGLGDGRFDIAYEKTSGDVLVVYSKNVATTNELGYRTKPGSAGCGSANWSGETLVNVAQTAGVVHWVRLEASPVSGSNNIAVAWADNASDLSAMQWTGAGFGIGEPTAALETNLERVSTSQDSLSFDLAYEGLTGNLMVVWGLSQSGGCTAGTTIATTNCIRYARYTGSWQPVAVIPTVADPATNIDIAGNPNSDELALASVDNSQADLSAAYWSGSAWTGFANQDAISQAASVTSKRVAVGWLTSGGTRRYVIVYNDSSTTNIGWIVGNTTTITNQTDVPVSPVFGNPQAWYEIQTDSSNPDRLMFTVSDAASDLHSKRLVMTAAPGFTWSNVEGGAVLETSMGGSGGSPFTFAYWKQ